MRTLSIVGARPQFIKLAPVSRAMTISGNTEFEDIVLHTGQHYDPAMSDIFFEQLKIPRPGIELAVGSGSHGFQTARMLEGIEGAIQEVNPDAVVIYGDTNSTLAGALAAAKLHIPVVHVEAGLRSFDRKMPEEVNRIVTDHLSELLLAPTETAVRNLVAENLGYRTTLVGDVMLDAVLYNETLANDLPDVRESFGLSGDTYAVVTLHRPINTDTRRLNIILGSLNQVASDFCDVIFPVHPRTTKNMQSTGLAWRPHPRLHLVQPLGYLQMLKVLRNASLAITDSGGLQKEASFLGTPCITLRDETEWPETIDAGANRLAGADAGSILSAVSDVWHGATDRAAIRSASMELFGHGRAAERIVASIARLGPGSPFEVGNAS